jgi:hypothetical protein
MADDNRNTGSNNYSPKRNIIETAIDEASDTTSLLLKLLLKSVFKPASYLFIALVIVPVIVFLYLGPWSLIKGLLGINNDRNTLTEITKGANNAGSYLREVTSEHELNFNINVKYIGDKNKPNKQNPQSIRFEDINDSGNNRVIEVNDN